MSSREASPDWRSASPSRKHRHRHHVRSKSRRWRDSESKEDERRSFHRRRSKRRYSSPSSSSDVARVSTKRKSRRRYRRRRRSQSSAGSRSPSERRKKRSRQRTRRRSYSKTRSRTRSRSPVHRRRRKPRDYYDTSESRRNRHDDVSDRYDRRRRLSRHDDRRRRSRRRRDHDRRRSSGSLSLPPRHQRQPHPDVIPPRAGVVSDDEAATGSADTVGNSIAPAAVKRGNATRDTKIKKSASSSRDDTVGHFRATEGVIADRYRIVREVGMGTFGRVVECMDMKRARSHNAVAIKIVRNIKRYYDSALIEAEIVEEVNRKGGRGLSHVAILRNTFSFSGHYCLVFEALGPSLYDFSKKQNYQPFPMVCIRDFATQLLETLEFLHDMRLIHTDLKPENILLLNHREVMYQGCKIPESTRIKVIDFGGATYDHEKKSSIVNTRQYRAPEVILGVGWSMPSDLWSLGCILAELYQGDLLFATHDNMEHLALIEQVIGPFSRRMTKKAKNAQIVEEAFDSSGTHRLERILPPESMAYVKRIAPLESILFEEDHSNRWFLRLLRSLLIIDPNERLTARECLRNL